MKTFRIENGDLVLGGEGFALVEGPDKVRQDLGVIVREPLGCDRFHPEWGSLLGGYVGFVTGASTETLIQAEIARLMSNYMAVQAQVLQSDHLASRSSRFTAGEVVDRVVAVDIQQSLDSYHVRVILNMLSSQDLVVQVPVRS